MEEREIFLGVEWIQLAQDKVQCLVLLGSIKGGGIY
jgi:hypothetical protein